MRTDLVIPARNERSSIDPLFDRLEPLRGETIRQVLLADNGSTDGTAEAAARRGAIVVREPRRGYGAACLAALAHLATLDPPPDAVAFLDADLADEPEALPTLLRPIEEGRARLVIGSRVRLADPGALNLVQRLGNRLACTLMWMLAGHRYTDLGPLRAIDAATLAGMHMQDQTWGWTVEMQMKAALLDVPILEVDVPYHPRRHGRSKISGTLRGVTSAGTRIILTILKLRLHKARLQRTARMAARMGSDLQ